MNTRTKAYSIVSRTGLDSLKHRGSRLAIMSTVMIYPFTPMAIIDLLSILPVFNALNDAPRTLRVLRLFRALRTFKLIRYAADALASVPSIVMGLLN